MTVKELKEKLEEFDNKLTVLAWSFDQQEFVDIQQKISRILQLERSWRGMLNQLIT